MGLENVYAVDRNMDGAERFYRRALDPVPSFRDQDRWCRFRVGGVSFVRSSVDEAAPGASRSVAVSPAESLDQAASRAQAAGGVVHGRRDMGSHSAILPCADPKGGRFQIFARGAA